ncbi:mechanosensitive ion channel family protein [Spongorhabdus nitratireducens]
MEQIQSLSESLGMGSSWFYQLVIILGLTLGGHIVARVMLSRLLLHARQTTTFWDDALLKAIRKPLVLLIWLMGMAWSATVIHELSSAPILAAVPAIRDVLIIVLLAWTVVRFIKQVERQLLKTDLTGKKTDATTITAIGRLLRISVIIVTVLVVMQTLGYSISGLLAFGGIGGIAIGFAAKDMLANFFGGLMIYLDRPFKVGDWIKSPDKQIEGYVQYIGWRQTEILTFEKRPLYVPNATFASISVENPSRMENRRIKETIGLRYQDAKVVSPILEEVRAYLDANEAIDKNKIVMVNFTTFGPSSLDFFIYCFTCTTDWKIYHREKEAVLLKVLEIIHRHGADVAYPTTTLDLPGKEVLPE